MDGPGRPASSALAVLCGALLFATSHPGLATPAASPSQQARQGLSLDAAVRLVEQRYRGRVVRAESERDPMGTVYVLRVLDASGHVFTVRVAADGSLL